MLCLDDPQVLDYLEHRLPETARDEVRLHLDGCADCLALVSQLSASAAARGADGLTLGRTIASGGMGLIVEAWDDKLARRIALKLPRTDDAGAQRRFAREVTITARLQHPAIVPVYAAGTLADGEPYYAMRLVDGESLESAIDRAATVRDRLGLVRVVGQVAGALAYAHAQGIVHRDIKPANILVGPFGEVVVIDWGLARSLRDPVHDELATGSPGPIAESTDTVDGTVLGTPAYMPPEQARGEPVDERADVYALGALLYHVLAGTPPGPKAPRLGDVPVDLVAIVDRAMAADAADRYPTARELAADLERFQTGRLVDAHAYSPWQLVGRWVRKHRAAVAVGTLLAIALGVTAIIASQRIGSVERTATTQRLATEDLVDYMLKDLQAKLAKIGKLDVLAGIGTEIDGYYVALGRAPKDLPVVDLQRWARAVDVLGDVAYEAGDLGRAKAHYERAVAMRGANGASHAKLGKVQRELGETPAALASFIASRDAFAKAGAPREQAEAMIHIGHLQLDQQKPQITRATFASALGIVEAMPREAPALRVERAAVEGLAIVDEHEGKLDQAMTFAERCVALAEQIVKLDDTPRDRQVVARSVQRIGAVAERAGDRVASLAAFTRSAKLLEELTVHDPANATFKRDLAEAIQRVGDAERALGHAKESAAAYDRSQAIRRALVELDPKNQTWQRELAMSYDSLARIEFDLGNLDRAEERYRTGLALVEKLVAQDPKNQLFKNDLYTMLGSVGRIVHARGDLDAALQWFERRLATANELVTAAPSNQHRFRLSTAHEDMSYILMDRGDAPAARAQAEKSLGIREQLVAESPENIQWIVAVATSLEMLAQAQDKPVDARPLIAKSIAHRRTLLAKDPADMVMRVDLLLGLMIEARVTRDLKDLPAATASQTEALSIAEALVKADPKSALLATYLEQSLEIGGDLDAAQARNADAATKYRAALAALAPFIDAALSDAHIAGEDAEARWKLSRVVTGPERASLVKQAKTTLEQLRKTKRLAPDRAKILDEINAAK